MTTGELLNISALDPLLPTFLIATLCLSTLSVITYYSLALAWDVFWASRRSPLPLDPSTEVVLTIIPLIVEFNPSKSPQRDWMKDQHWVFHKREENTLAVLRDLRMYQGVERYRRDPAEHQISGRSTSVCR